MWKMDNVYGNVVIDRNNKEVFCSKEVWRKVKKKLISRELVFFQKGAD